MNHVILQQMEKTVIKIVFLDTDSYTLSWKVSCENLLVNQHDNWEIKIKIWMQGGHALFKYGQIDHNKNMVELNIWSLWFLVETKTEGLPATTT